MKPKPNDTCKLKFQRKILLMSSKIFGCDRIRTRVSEFQVQYLTANKHSVIIAIAPHILLVVTIFGRWSLGRQLRSG